VNQDKRERLRHRVDYRSGLQPSFVSNRSHTWGFAPGWYKTAPLALSQSNALAERHQCSTPS
jgi:hypothetical protein